MDDSQLETKLKKSLQNYSNIFFQQQRQKDHPNSFTNNQNSTLKDIQNETKRKKKKKKRKRKVKHSNSDKKFKKFVLFEMWH